VILQEDVLLRLNNNTIIANKTTTVGPQMPPFSSSGVSGAFTCSRSGGEVSTGGAGEGVSNYHKRAPGAGCISNYRTS